MADEAPFKLVVTEGRLKGMKYGVIRKAQSDPDAQYKFLMAFMEKPEGGPFTFDEAAAILDEFTVEEIGGLFERTLKASQEAAAPKG